MRTQLPKIGPGFGRLQQPNYWAVEKLDQFMKPDYDLFFTQIGELDTLGWCWDGEGGYDHAQYEYHVGRILAKKPGSKVILFLGGRAPYAWQRDHQEELVVLENGTRTNVPSMRSPAWIADTTEACRRLVEYFEASPYADSIAGYNPILLGNEWLTRTFHSDYSENAVQRFRDWLRAFYKNDLAALRRNWMQPDVTFETAAVPRTPDYQAHGLNGQFDRLEQFGTQCADHLRFFNEGAAALVCSHAKAIKEASNRKKLVSVMYGYTYSYGQMGFGLANSGHADMLQVLNSPDIDLIHCPYDYYNRCIGGPHYSQISADSVQAHGKIFATQIDSKLHMHDFDRGNAQTPWESDQVLKRDVSFAIMRNACHYYYEMNVPCWRGYTGTVEWRDLGFLGDSVQKIMCQLKQLANDNHAEQPASVTDVAIFSSRESAYARAYNPSYGFLYLQGMRNFFLAYAGVPFHDFILEDFDLVAPDYKVYIFPDASLITTEQRRRIRERLERAGATALWFYAPGYVSEDHTGLDNMEALTGITFKKRSDVRDFIQIDFDRYDHPLTQGLEAIGSYGSDLTYEFFQEKQEWLPWQLKERDQYKFSPMFCVDDPDAECLGTLRAAREPGLAVKQVGPMTSIFSAAPCPPPELFRNIFKNAGVHLYSNRTDIVYANARYVTVCANGDGQRTVRFPRSGKISDALTGEVLAENADAYTYSARQGQTDIFRMD
jgi:hypothetical protein